MSSQSGGHRVCRGPSSSIRCSTMLPHMARGNVIGSFTRVRGSPPLNGIWRWKPPPWISPGMLWADIRNIYNDVYQLRKLLGESSCDDAMAKKICQSILESVKECLWCRWEHAQLPGQWGSTRTPRSDPPLEFQTGTCAPYKHIKPDSYEEALALAQDAHHQELIAAHLL